MESVERAKKRGCQDFRLYSGYGTTCDGVDRINPASDGKELAQGD